MADVEDLLIRHGARGLTLTEVVQRINGFVRQLDGVEFILIVHRREDPLSADGVTCASNLQSMGRAQDIAKCAAAAYGKTTTGATPPQSRIIRPD